MFCGAWLLPPKMRINKPYVCVCLCVSVHSNYKTECALDLFVALLDKKTSHIITKLTKDICIKAQYYKQVQADRECKTDYK